MIDNQWRTLPNADLPQNIKMLIVPDDFWESLLDHEYDDIKEFQELAQFALNVLIVPHSNAQCERIFSKVNLIKKPGTD